MHEGLSALCLESPPPSEYQNCVWRSLLFIVHIVNTYICKILCSVPVISVLIICTHQHFVSLSPYKIRDLNVILGANCWLQVSWFQALTPHSNYQAQQAVRPCITKSCRLGITQSQITNLLVTTHHEYCLVIVGCRWNDQSCVQHINAGYVCYQLIRVLIINWMLP